ncbi:TniB family NTP-binding protein [Litchfieldia alkalitelluris]|uniref:TniB family NTP-binding protein n=1 Tax=Litchfieldia alkalitelluris TaxID=304268 RepID=UPI0009984D25|nr:TniB family NTP-binding protein [Litchfieldia alkalitelluris]
MNPYKEFQLRVVSIYVEHPDVTEIWNLLDGRRMYRRLNFEAGGNDTPINLFIKGKSRVGKTQMMKRYVTLNKKYEALEKDEYGREVKVDVVPVVYVKLPSIFTPSGFYLKLLAGLGAPTITGKIDELQERVYHLIRKQKVEMIILDEMDYILSVRYISKKQSMELVKDLTNSTDVAIVCVGTPDTEELRSLNSQLCGRFAPRTIDYFQECDERFYTVLELIDKQLGVEKYFCLSDRNSKLGIILHHLSYGLVGWLVPILNEAFRLIGVFDPGFNNLKILENIDAEILMKAQQNIIGDMDDKKIKEQLLN